MQQVENKLNIFQDYEIALTLTDNPYDFEPLELFQMATRINKKRRFLFVSTVLGKHLAVRPQMPLLIGTLLAMDYVRQSYQQEAAILPSVVKALKKEKDPHLVLQEVERQRVALKEETLFIGFAETATALGHAVFNYFQSNATYIHTTRELIPNIEPFVTFEEEHSHATSHRLYVDDPEKLRSAKKIVLIDDEITTGNTVINIVETLQHRFPNVEHYTVLSILDWRSDTQKQIFKQLEQQWGITIQFSSIVSGQFACTGEPIVEVQANVQPAIESDSELSLLSISENVERKYYRSIAENGKENASPYMLATGRFGLTASQQHQQRVALVKVAKYLQSFRSGGPALVVGTGEFMYVPMQLAAEMGGDVYFQSTTRSPIYRSDEEDYTIKRKIAFESPENNGVENYLYNADSRPYTELFLIVERIANKESVTSIEKALQTICNGKIYIVCMHDWEGME